MDRAMKVHDDAKAFETLPAKESAQLREDIKQIGIRVPILINKAGDTIIDGRNRWMIAYDLGLRKSQVPVERFKGNDEDIPAEILRLNVFRRHLTDDQRTAAVAKLRGPQLEAEAQKRKAEQLRKGDQVPVRSKSTSRGITAETETPDETIDFGKTTDKIAEEAKTTPYKAKQAEKARKAGLIDDVIQKKMTLKQAAQAAGESLPRNQKGKDRKKEKWRAKPLAFQDEVWLLWSRLLKKFPQTQQRDVAFEVITLELSKKDEHGDLVAPVSVTYRDHTTADIHEVIYRKNGGRG
jgi:hypothetical protein